MRYHNGKWSPTDIDPTVFVFGSNLLGQHAGGAAAFAEQFGCAIHGIGQGYVPGHGPQGCKSGGYALPTMAMPGVPLTLRGVEAAVTLFVAYAVVRNDLTFFVTRVGCGIAGFADGDIAPLFAGAPENCIFPPEWKSILG